MAIESTRRAFVVKNDVLRRLLSKYVRLELLGLDEDTERLTVIYEVPDGWYYRPNKTSVVGQVIEQLLISDTPAVAAALKDADSCDLHDEAGNRTRYYFEPPANPAPPDYQWVIDIKPNRADKRAAAV
jgi:hypothetical protein